MQYEVRGDFVIVYDTRCEYGIAVKDVHCCCRKEEFKDFVDEFNRVAKEIIDETQNKDTNI